MIKREHLRELPKVNHWRVSFETDIKQYDQHDRLLVYHWSGDKTFINEKILPDGYAILFTIQPNSKYVRSLLSAQRIARQE